MKKWIKRIISVAAVSLVIMLTPTQSVGAAASTQSVAFPMYEYPTIGSLWSDVYNAGNQVPWIIVNPASGPGASVDSTYTTYLNNKPSSQRAIGYVHTNYGARNITEVLDDINKWYAMYPHISGIFVDLIQNGGAAADVCYVATVYNYVKSSHPNDLVVMNPGSNIEAAYEPYGDIFANMENTYVAYTSWSPRNDGFENNAAYASRFWHIVHTANASDLNSALALTRTNNAGWVLITDEGMPNPYTAVPSYWSSFLSSVSALPKTTIPNRGLTALPVGCLDLSLATSRKSTTQTKQTTTTVTNTVTNLDTSRFSPGTTTLTYATPAGTTLAGLNGSGWSCSTATKKCTNSSNISAGGVLPAVTATVTVSCSYTSGSIGITIKNFANNTASASATLDKPKDCTTASNNTPSSSNETGSDPMAAVEEKTVTTATPQQGLAGEDDQPGDGSTRTARAYIMGISLGVFVIAVAAGVWWWYFYLREPKPQKTP